MATLADFATTRSGDKGNHANLGVVAFGRGEYEHLEQHLTPVVVAAYFAELGVSKVERFELPNVLALNFLLHNALAGGASRSLRIDTQGKLIGTLALDLPLAPRNAEGG